MDLSTVRAEIKAWERSFRSTHNRDPTVQELKDNHKIAEKYKLYKKLSKLAANTTEAGDSVQVPSTPPRRPAALPAKRVIETPPPHTGFNPFSPSKDRHKKQPPLHPTIPNPFATPVKNKRQPRTPSPDLFPPIQAQPSESDTSNPALVRARKRLRGDPVSPSPNKDKRRRVSSHLFPLQNVDDVNDDEDAAEDPGSPFLGDSPVKPPAGGKSFRVLFGMDLPPVFDKQRESVLSQTKSVGLSSGVLPPTNQDIFQGPIPGNRKPNGGSFPTAKLPSKNGNSVLPSARIPSKDNLFAIKDERDRKPDSRPSKPSSNPPAPAKRLFSDTDLAFDSRSRVDPELQRSPVMQLLRPSPPPAESRTSKYIAKGKERAIAGSSRKKAKFADGDGEDEEEDEAGFHKVKVVDVFRRTDSFSKLTEPEQTDGEADSADLFLSSFSAGSTSQPTASLREGNFEVNLPESLQRVLALSPSKSTTSKEESTIRGLLYGDRRAMYDGEVWEIGEVGEGEIEDGDDEWEGEGVPWEVAEL